MLSMRVEMPHLKKTSNENILPASFLQQNLQIGRGKYQVLKKVFSGNFGKENITLPAWNSLRDFQKRLTPKTHFDTSLPGVRFDYGEALSKTLSGILEGKTTKTVNLKQGS